ncbi:MAG: hypothetical protein ACYTFY_22855, partial [Planctomycetota bacterium]
MNMSTAAPLLNFGNGYKRTVVKKAEGEDPVFKKLFETAASAEAEKVIINNLPLDIMPLHRIFAVADYKKLKGLRPVQFMFFRQTPFFLGSSQHGEGRVAALNYFGEDLKPGYPAASLTPQLTYDPLIYDYSYALL